jgi:DNA helicase IV
VAERSTLDPQLAAEIRAEQTHVDAAYARLEAMRRAAASVAEAYADVGAGGTHQARLERDIAVDLTHRRLADLEIGESPLVFGRLDLEADGRWYIGRLAVDDADHTPLVVDWRAPIAEPFYRATAMAPMAVVRRRHFITRRGREITGLDDEVFDRDAIEGAGLTVAGEGALLAALDRNRTGRMGDIVATIQAEQDEAIRADLAGLLVVTGGPGTGKTAVALHRAAYLLYTHRRRLSSQGVLLIGPSPVFLHYIEQVLPSLGEQDVQLSTLAGLKPRLSARIVESVDVAALKGDARMAEVIARAVADRERPLRRDLALVIDGLRLRFSRGDSARIVNQARRRRGTHNAKRPFVTRRVLDVLVDRYATAAARAYKARRLDAGRHEGDEPGERELALATIDTTIAGALSRGEAPPDDWSSELRARLRKRPEVHELLERSWPVLSGAELVHDLFGFRALVRSAAEGILRADEQLRLNRRRVDDVAHAPWTDADIALVDEADALLGPVEAARPRRRARRVDQRALDSAAAVIGELGLEGMTDAATLAQRFADPLSTNGDGAAAEPRTFGHVLVDEAQDLTAMQWRMLARRCPSGSMTLVGDPGQASRPGALASWNEIVALLPRHVPPRYATLTVNYRTPAEIMDVAARLLAVAAPTVEPSRSVRRVGIAPTFAVAGHRELLAASAAAARTAHAQSGTVALIAPRAIHGALVDTLSDLGAVADTVEALDAPIAVLDAADAKGLEFDHVVVVEPSRLVTPDRAGLRLLYVTITRAMKTLTVVHADPLPEALVAS